MLVRVQYVMGGKEDILYLIIKKKNEFIDSSCP